MIDKLLCIGDYVLPGRFINAASTTQSNLFLTCLHDLANNVKAWTWKLSYQSHAAAFEIIFVICYI